jgi:DNA-binding XRE family transcriptional regulator
MRVTRGQLRAARAMAAMSVKELADRAQVHRRTIRRLECGDKEPQLRVLRRVGEALRGAGIEFTEDGGVRPKNQDGT